MPNENKQMNPVINPQVNNFDKVKTTIKGEATSLNNVRRHKTLGEFRKVIVHPTVHAQQNTNVFASIGLYTAEFKPGIEVELPQDIITLIKDATAASHYFDKDAISENGNRGAHLTGQVKKYIVEMV